MGSMSKISRRALMKCGVASAGLPVVSKLLGSPAAAQAQAKSDLSFAAVPGQKGVQDVFGAYDVDPNWPQPLSALPGNEQWSWGSAEGIFAENPPKHKIQGSVERGLCFSEPSPGRRQPCVPHPPGRLPAA